MDSYTIDFRPHVCETREVREGQALLLQFRTNVINYDGTIDYGEWRTSGSIPNYGECFD